MGLAEALWVARSVAPRRPQHASWRPNSQHMSSTPAMCLGAKCRSGAADGPRFPGHLALARPTRPGVCSPATAFLASPPRPRGNSCQTHPSPPLCFGIAQGRRPFAKQPSCSPLEAQPRTPAALPMPRQVSRQRHGPNFRGLRLGKVSEFCDAPGRAHRAGSKSSRTCCLSLRRLAHTAMGVRARPQAPQWLGPGLARP